MLQNRVTWQDHSYPTTVVSRDQIVSSIGEEVTATQYHTQAVDDDQDPRKTLDDKLQFLTHMEDVRAQDKQQYDRRRWNLYMSHRTA